MIVLQTWKVASQQCESYGWEESFTGIGMGWLAAATSGSQTLATKLATILATLATKLATILATLATKLATILATLATKLATILATLVTKYEISKVLESFRYFH
ncbi:hypothetical protein AVEN_231182-1 [Araneus ventricosus]|uniref:Uncharacterized protein n=1 Tax=Araneus ventricosus TaxID=182803 RepID=A0A4Y2NHH4_ARAVE|nr:hypothetical protein AVEN_231182-1 [Araneus ventricosus]